ncbi:hypothetical protein [Halomonas sp. BC04]|uniref:hypothetical protein n=1 Tax=Halomonas sp. BC04 TaxID=1403540 RepID=UPI0003ED7105|nr:hypothetical protein [Halomonas sp. BC04]EWH03834.1 hypothetical protein Q427_01215 [Halomonas sp. BC04]
MNTRDPTAPEHPATEQFDAALERLAQARLAEPLAAKDEVLESARAVMTLPGGLDALYARVSAIESAGVFANSDWEQPVILQPALAMRSLRQGEASLTVIEVLNEIRLLAVARGDVFHPGISPNRPNAS